MVLYLEWREIENHQWNNTTGL